MAAQFHGAGVKASYVPLPKQKPHHWAEKICGEILGREWRLKGPQTRSPERSTTNRVPSEDDNSRQSELP